MAADDPELALAEIDRCAADLLYWVDMYVWTYDPRLDVRGQCPDVPFVTYPYQDEALITLRDAIGVEDIITNKSRDMGATWCCLLPMDWRWLFRTSQSFILVSRNDDYVDKSGDPKSLFWKLDYIHKTLPRWMLSSSDFMRSKSHIEHLGNSSHFEGEATTGNVAAGARCTAMLLDEFAKFPPGDGRKALSSTADVTNSRFLNSTPLGTANQFYVTWIDGKTKQLPMHWSVHPVKARGLYTTNEMGQAKILDVEYAFPPDYPWVLDKKLRSPWYDAECRRRSDQEVAQELDMVFHGSGASYFSEDLIRELMIEKVLPPFLSGIFVWDQELREARLDCRSEGPAHLWMQLAHEKKPPPGRKYVMGVDIAAGNGASNSVIVVADMATGEQIFEYASSRISPTDLADMACAIAWWFNEAFMVWDGPGHGLVFKNHVSDNGYSNIYFKRDEKTMQRKTSKTPGHFAKGPGKVAVFANYRERLVTRQYINHSKMGIEELRQFQYNGSTIIHSGALMAEDPSGAQDNHGDRVTASVMCCLGMTERQELPAEKTGIAPPGTYGHLFAQRPKKPAESQWD